MAIAETRVLPVESAVMPPSVASGRRIVLAAFAVFAVSVAAALIARPVTAAEVSRVDAIAVCPPELRPALTGWMARRGDEGLAIRVVEPDVSAEETRKRIATAAVVGQTRYVILVGDSRLTMQGRPANPRCYLPTIYQRADATAAYQQTVSLPGDYLYGDFDGDGVVNAAVGRLPVGSVAQAAELFDRIAQYEQSRDFGRWRSRVDLVAGLGGFGPLIDGAIETVASGMITGSLPGSVRTRVTHAGPDSLFCPGPHCFTDTVLANYGDGARFWVYAGHGHIRELDRVPASQQGRPVLAVDDVANLSRPADSAPIALLLACYTGAYDATEDCLAKEMLLASGGPIAVLAGSRVTMPYGNAAAAMGLIHAVYHRRPERLGDAWLETLDEMATPSDAKPDLRSRRVVIDGLATMLGDGRIDAERREHMQLYNWLGDPTLRLCHPDEIVIDPTARIAAGEVAVITGHATMPGKMTVELHRRLGTKSPGPPTVTPTVSPASAARANTPNANIPDPGVERYRLANDTAIATATLRIAQAGPWRAEVAVPEGVSGPMRWIVDLEGQNGFASGSQSSWIRPAGR